MFTFLLYITIPYLFFFIDTSFFPFLPGEIKFPSSLLFSSELKGFKSKITLLFLFFGLSLLLLVNILFISFFDLFLIIGFTFFTSSLAGFLFILLTLSLFSLTSFDFPFLFSFSDLSLGFLFTLSILLFLLSSIIVLSFCNLYFISLTLLFKLNLNPPNE